MIAPARAAGLAASVEPAPLTFIDERSLTLKVPDIKGSTDFGAVCNTGTTQVRLTAQVTGFEFKIGQSAVADDAVLAVRPTTADLAPGMCTPITGQIVNPDRLDPGTYAGVLVARTQHAGLARRLLSIVKSDAAALGELVGDAKLWGRRTLVGDDVHLRGGVLVFAAKDPAAAAAAMKQGRPLGVLSDDGTIVTVSVASDAKALEKVVQVPLSVGGVAGQGKYAGALSVPGRCDPVPAEITLADSAWLAVAALLAGVLLGLLTRTVNQRWSVLFRLWRARNALPKAYKSAANCVAKLQPWIAARYVRPSDGAIMAFTAKSRAVTETMRAKTWTIDKDDPGYTSVLENLTKAERDASYFGAETDGFCDALVASARNSKTSRHS